MYRNGRNPEKSDNLTAVLFEKKDLRIVSRDTPKPGKNEVLLAMKSVGICGSDVKYWTTGKCGRFTLEKPMVIGHEGSGVVEQVGEDVTHLKAGDRVAIEPGVPCRHCKLCKLGSYNLCPQIRFCATPPDDGNLCQYYTHDAEFCFKLPENVSQEEGALVEPLAVAVYGCQRGGVDQQGDPHVLITGAGPVGLLCLLVAKSMGAKRVCITDVDEHRLQIAKEYGADCTLLVSRSCQGDEASRNLAEKVVETLGTEPDAALECSGADSSLLTGIYATRPGGSVVMIGRGSMHVSVPIVYAATKEVDIKGVFRYRNVYPKAIKMIADGRIDVKQLITHRFPLIKTQDAFETARDSVQTNAIKVMINCS